MAAVLVSVAAGALLTALVILPALFYARRARAYRTMLDAAPDSLVLLDRAGKVLFCSSSARDMLHVDPDQVALAFQASPDQVHLRMPDGTWLRVHAVPAPALLAPAPGFLLSISALDDADSLTGLVTRSQAMSLLTSRRASDRPSAVLFADVDGLKRVNDTQGHAAGDELLALVASRIRGAVRSADVVARWGGDEFLVLLYGISLPSQLSELARKVVQSVHSSGPGSVSVGVSLLAPAQDISQALCAADVAMYKAKAQGGNTYC